MKEIRTWVANRFRRKSDVLKEPWHLLIVMCLLWANAGVALLLTLMGRCGAKDPDDGYFAGVLEAAVPVLEGITALIAVLAFVTTWACYNVRQAFNKATGEEVSFYVVEPLLEAGQHTLKRVLTSGGVLFTLAISVLAIVTANPSENNDTGDQIVSLMIAASIFLLATGAVSLLFDLWVAKAKHQARRDEISE